MPKNVFIFVCFLNVITCVALALYAAFSSSLSSFHSLEISVILSFDSNCFSALLDSSFLENKLYPELGGLSGFPSCLMLKQKKNLNMLSSAKISEQKYYLCLICSSSLVRRLSFLAEASTSGYFALKFSISSYQNKHQWLLRRYFKYDAMEHVRDIRCI